MANSPEVDISNIDLSALSYEEMVELKNQLAREEGQREIQRFEEVERQYIEGAKSLGMTPEEVIMRMQRGGKKTVKRTAKSAQYMNPENPRQTWTGRGKRPNWLNEKLENGAKLEDFKV